MSLKQFMQELDEELEVLPENRRREIMKGFEAQTEKALELGDTEEYLLKILDDPRKVAEKFIAQEIVEEEPEIEPEPVNIATAEVRPVTGSFASEINQYEINYLSINGEMLDVTVEAGRKFSIKFLSYTHKGKLDYQVGNDKLSIFHSGAKDEVKFNTIIDFMKKRQQLKKDELIITWPSKLEELNINNKNGKVLINQLEAEEFKIKTNEGPVECVKLSGNYGNFQSSMGTLKIEHSKFNNLHMKTEMGKIIAAEVASERYNLVTELGKIVLKNLKTDSDINALSKMGSVSVSYREKPKHTKIVARANVGKVKNALAKNTIDKQLHRAEYMSEMGSVKITLS